MQIPSKASGSQNFKGIEVEQVSHSQNKVENIVLIYNTAEAKKLSLASPHHWQKRQVLYPFFGH